MTTLKQLTQANGNQIAEAFQVTQNAGVAVVNYMLAIKWGYGIQGATDAASDFLDNEEDLNGLQKVLKIAQTFSS